MAYALLGLNVVYLAALLLKLGMMCEHFPWVYANGRRYRSLLDTLRQQDRTVTLGDLYDEVLSLGPDWIKPFGVNEFKARVLWRRHLEAPFMMRRARGYMWFAGVLLFHVIALSWIGAVLLIVTGATQSRWLTTEIGPVISWLGLLNSVVLILIPVSLAVEANVHYAQMGLFAFGFHRPLSYINDPRVNTFIDELAMLVSLAICALFVDAAAINVQSTVGRSFNTDGLTGISGLFSDAYHGFMTFIFSTQLQPANAWGQVTVILISLQGIGLLVLALAAFTSTGPVTPGEKNAKA
jgi:hypothetical protein